MRKLPVYLLIDTSGSMIGEPIEAVQNGLNLLVSTLRKNPYALDTAHLSVITFDSSAKQVVPMTELPSFLPPTLQAGGLTALGEALELLADCMDREVQKRTLEESGDWKPIIFLLSDGIATDNLEQGIQAIRKKSFAIFVACAAGSGADIQELQRVTDTVVSLDTADSNTIAQFFAWVSDSVGSSSEKIEKGQENTGLNTLPPPPPEIKINLGKSSC